MNRTGIFSKGIYQITWCNTGWTAQHWHFCTVVRLRTLKLFQCTRLDVSAVPRALNTQMISEEPQVWSPCQRAEDTEFQCHWRVASATVETDIYSPRKSECRQEKSKTFPMTSVCLRCLQKVLSPLVKNFPLSGNPSRKSLSRSAQHFLFVDSRSD